MLEDGGEPQTLLVEDNPGDARLIEEMLANASWPELEDRLGRSQPPSLTVAGSLADGIEALTEETVLVLLDLGLPDASGLETLDRMLEHADATPVVVLTGLADEQAGIEAVRSGAQDYLVKDEIDRSSLRRTVRHAIERGHHQRQLRRRAEELAVLTRVLRHDIVDDMSVALGRARALREHVENGGEPYLEEVIDAVDEVLDVTEAAQEFLRVTEDDDGARPVALASVLEPAMATLGDDHVDLEGDLPSVTVRGNDLLPSALENLLVDAVGTPETDGGDDVVGLSVEVEEQAVVIGIAGDGAATAEPGRGEPFELRETYASGVPRTGAGLYLADAIVDRLGGRVVVEDDGDDRSLFRVSLPRAVDEESDDEDVVDTRESEPRNGSGNETETGDEGRSAAGRTGAED